MKKFSLYFAVSILLVCLMGSAGAAMETDVLIIGAGGGGLTAAVSAADNGASVIVVEKMPFAGGNTLLSTGAIYASASIHQVRQDQYRPPQAIAETLLQSADGTANPELVRFLASETGNTINWLETVGVSFLDQPGIVLAEDGGYGLIGPLEEAAKERGVEILLETKAVELVTDHDRVTGAVVEQNDSEFIINAETVVVATGGFAANRDMVEEHKPEYAHLPISAADSATGDGIGMAQDVGAAVVDLDKVMPVPTADAETGRTITAMMRGEQGASVLLNEAGQRFSDETKLYEPLTHVVLDELENQERPYVFQVFDATALDNVPIAASYVAAGLTTKADSLQDLAEALDIDAAALVETIEKYNANIEAGKEDPFGRSAALRPIEEGPFYAMTVKPGLLATRGGLKFNQQAQVLAENGQPIPGLYAAGETTGGIFGAGYQGGAFLTVAATFGRIAGTQAAIEALIE